MCFNLLSEENLAAVSNPYFGQFVRKFTESVNDLTDFLGMSRVNLTCERSELVWLYLRNYFHKDRHYHNYQHIYGMLNWFRQQEELHRKKNTRNYIPEYSDLNMKVLPVAIFWHDVIMMSHNIKNNIYTSPSVSNGSGQDFTSPEYLSGKEFKEVFDGYLPHEIIFLVRHFIECTRMDIYEPENSNCNKYSIQELFGECSILRALDLYYQFVGLHYMDISKPISVYNLNTRIQSENLDLSPIMFYEFRISFLEWLGEHDELFSNKFVFPASVKQFALETVNESIVWCKGELLRLKSKSKK